MFLKNPTFSLAETEAMKEPFSVGNKVGTEEFYSWTGVNLSHNILGLTGFRRYIGMNNTNMITSMSLDPLSLRNNFP